MSEISVSERLKAVRSSFAEKYETRDACLIDDAINELDLYRTAIVLPDDLTCGEIVHSGAWDCECECDPDRNICFLDADGMKRVTHLQCRECKKLTPFWDGAGMIKEITDLQSAVAAKDKEIEGLREDKERLNHLADNFMYSKGEYFSVRSFQVEGTSQDRHAALRAEIDLRMSLKKALDQDAMNQNNNGATHDA